MENQMREDNRKSITEHPIIKEFIDNMKKDNRCQECLSIFGKGICSCGKIKTDVRYRDIQILANELIKQGGWKS